MSKQDAEWKARAAECHRAALTAMERATNITDTKMKAEFLQMATELLKLAEVIDGFIARTGEDAILN
jgi:hypothetical protein